MIGNQPVSDHMKRAAKTLKSFRKAVAKPLVLPPAMAYLFIWYMEIRARQSRGFRVEPIALTEILAYATLYELAIQPWEVDILCRLDAVWLSCLPEPEADKRGRDA